MSAADLPLAEAAARLRAGELGDEELVEAVLARCTERSDLGAWELLDAGGAREQARACAAARRAGDDRPLLGIPVAVKDLIDVAGLPTRAGARAWRRRPRRDAVAVARLRAAGAVVLGKTHTNEFAYGIDGANPHRDPCRNPHDPDRLPGGSSSGSAVAVAAGMALGALGSDTSGSLRVPAALCGVTGLRTTRGAVPRTGVVTLAAPYDSVGPMARDAEGTWLLWEALRTQDAMGAAAPKRSGAERRPCPKTATGPGGAGRLGTAARPGPERRRVGLLTGLLAHATPHVEAATRAFAAALDAEIVDLPGDALPEDVVAAHLTVQQAAAARAHRRRFAAEADRYAPDVRARLERGQALSADDVRAAERITRAAARATVRLLEEVDALLAPAAPDVAPRRDAAHVTIRGERLAVREALLALPVPLTQHGGPVLAVPAGTVGGLPVGVQLAGRPGDEDLLLALATP